MHDVLVTTIVFLHAHPDDESTQTSGSMARASAGGDRVVVVYATNGDHGEAPDDLGVDETVADRRRTEAEASARADRVIARVTRAGGDVVLFGHGHILRIIGARWLGLAPELAASLALNTAALCDLGFERERRVIWLWNDTSHARSLP